MEINKKIEWTKEHMPVVEKIRQEFLETQPFKGIGVGACLHLTKETAILLMAIKDAGAVVTACASNPLSTQDDVVQYLKDYGITVHGKKGMSEEDYKAGLKAVGLSSCQYMIDDGGDLTEFIHTNGNVAMTFPKGGLEQTTTGVTRIKNMELKYPILAVNDADTKHLFDNVYGTGQSTLDGIIRATNILLAGKVFVVAGYGNCGKGLAQRARGMGCNVIVTEIDPIKALQAYMDGFKVMKMENAATFGDIFVTVTGSKNVITAQNLFNVKDGAILANSGHFDVEIEMSEINKLFKPKKISDDITEYERIGSYAEEATNVPRSKFFILSEGRLVNLSAAEGHPSEVMDMSFSNQLLGLRYLIERTSGMDALFFEPGVHEIPKDIDIQVASLKLKALGLYIDTETKEQEEYRKS